MATSNTIDLSQIPPPDVIEPLSYETIYAAMRAQVIGGIPGVVAGIPDFDDSIESDPAVKVLQIAAYSKLLDRARVNDAAMARMLAYATGNDLVHIGVLVGVEKFEGETDDELRERILLAPYGYSVAGPESAYIFHARAADADVKDATAVSPAPAEVLVSILSKTGDGTASEDLIATVQTALSASTKRPLTDLVTVQSAEIINYAIIAQILTYTGPDPTIVLNAALVALAAYVAGERRLGRDITLNGIGAALRVGGVQNVLISSPTEDIPISPSQASNCTGMTITLGGVGE